MKEEGLSAWKTERKSDFIDYDEATWLINNCSRADAERLLDGLPSGTFLVRPRVAGHFALSITCNDMINHCILYQTERGYGFTGPYFIYASLQALILHYSKNSLEEHNDELKTTLKYPIYSSFIKNLKKNYWIVSFYNAAITMTFILVIFFLKKIRKKSIQEKKID